LCLDRYFSKALFLIDGLMSTKSVSEIGAETGQQEIKKEMAI